MGLRFLADVTNCIAYRPSHMLICVIFMGGQQINSRLWMIPEIRAARPYTYSFRYSPPHVGAITVQPFSDHRQGCFIDKFMYILSAGTA